MMIEELLSLEGGRSLLLPVGEEDALRRAAFSALRRRRAACLEGEGTGEVEGGGEVVDEKGGGELVAVVEEADEEDEDDLVALRLKRTAKEPGF